MFPRAIIFNQRKKREHTAKSNSYQQYSWVPTEGKETLHGKNFQSIDKSLRQQLGPFETIMPWLKL